MVVGAGREPVGQCAVGAALDLLAEQRFDARTPAEEHLLDEDFGRLGAAQCDDLSDELLDRGVLLRLVLVDADDGLATGIDARLGLRRGLLDPEFRQARFDGFRHAAHLFDFLDMSPGFLGDFGSGY